MENNFKDRLKALVSDINAACATDDFSTMRKHCESAWELMSDVKTEKVINRKLFSAAYDAYVASRIFEPVSVNFESIVDHDPYLEGAIAFKPGAVPRNPYPAGSDDWRVWNTGLETAKAERGDSGWTEEPPKEPGWYVINEQIGAGKVGVYDVTLHKSGELVYGGFNLISGVIPGSTFLRIPAPIVSDVRFEPGDVIEFCDEHYEVIENHGFSGVVRDSGGVVISSFIWNYQGCKCVLVRSAIVSKEE